MEEKPLCQCILISKETGKQVRLDLDAPIEPWPTPRPGGWVNELPSQKLSFSGELVIKKGSPSYWRFKMLMYDWYKLPRKMKKAFKHIKEYKPIAVVERKGKYEVLGGIMFHTKDGYPYTKWVRKTIGKAFYKKGQIPMVKTALGKEIENVLKGETK